MIHGLPAPALPLEGLPAVALCEGGFIVVWISLNIENLMLIIELFSTLKKADRNVRFPPCKEIYS